MLNTEQIDPCTCYFTIFIINQGNYNFFFFWHLPFKKGDKVRAVSNTDTSIFQYFHAVTGKSHMTGFVFLNFFF